MNPRTYKYGFVVAVVVCLGLAAVLAGTLWNRQEGTTAPSANPIVAQGPEVSLAPAPAAEAPSAGSRPLTPVQLDPRRMQAIGVKTAAVELRQVNKDLLVPGNVEVNQRRLAYVQTRFPGWIQKVFANAPYQYVRKGQPMFTIYSPELVSTEQEYLLARKNQSTFSGTMHGMAAQESGWLLQAAADRLRQFGVPAEEIARLERTGTVQHDVSIEAPISGYVTEFNALPNQYVEAQSRLYTIADLSTVWINANVFQTDVGSLRPGTAATVSLDAYPGRTFHGRIEQVLPQVDSATRTVPVRLDCSNPGVFLKPGMYVNVDISVPLGKQLVIPDTGVLESGTRQIAFLYHPGGYLEPRQVQVGPRLDDHIVITKGLKAGERVVSSANFLVDSDSQLQQAVSSFASPASPAPSAAGPASGGVRMELNTDPSPLRAGANVVRATLTGPDGKPLTGVEVTVTAFMPAMPGMGMAAMRNVVTLQERSPGVYQAPLQLQSGGTWQVMVMAKRGGQTVLNQQLSLSATGGMQ